MYFLKRLASLVPLLLVISFLAFALVKATPGSPFDRERKPASPEIERAIRAKFHADEPFFKQYLRYIGLLWERDSTGKWQYATPSFDTSIKYRNHTVTDIISQALPVSMTLGGLAFCFAIGVGIPIGFYSAVKRGQWQDYSGSLAALLMVCVPGLVIGPSLVMTFAIKLQWLPVALWVSPLHVILPTAALGLYYSGRVARLMREGMLGTMNSEFITAARAKGLTEFQLQVKHAFRLAVLPVVSYSGPMLADLLTGSFVIESIFQIPGLGQFFINSSLNGDNTMTVGLALVYATLLVVLNLMVDFAYTLLDPRVKYA
ncbi:MAG TPA: ABC transporter permease [Verrucomicrobiae bacterium]|nr:ABC transporter permease [Verrucomicrobiae bacterium]